MVDRDAPEQLRVGRRALEGIPGITLLDDLSWHPAASAWVLHCRLSPEVAAGGPVPPETDWYVLISTGYPAGSVKFHPSKVAGIDRTFPHQSYNAAGAKDLPWREGDLCLNTSVRVLNRMGTDREPKDAESRLLWHFLRSLEWLRRASTGDLLAPGDPYELPRFPGARLLAPPVVTCEGADTLETWNTLPERSGLVELAPLPGKRGGVFARAFKSLARKPVLVPSWGRHLSEAKGDPQTGIWIRLPAPPILDPWQAPATWAELRRACSGQGVDLDNLLKPALDFLRDGKAHLALIGFPIPARVGEAPVQMHWQALTLPVLTWDKITVHGFRPGKLAYWTRDRMQLLSGDGTLKWQRSENWHPDQVSTRGRLPAYVRSRKILVIGAGALGSAVAELLLRAGVHSMVILDGDVVEVGNLVRHSLTVDDIGDFKAAALAERLNRASPHAAVQHIVDFFPPASEKDLALVQECDVVLDTTGSDEVIDNLEGFSWASPRTFISVSTGYGAARLFCFSAHGPRFPVSQFIDELQPYLRLERDAHKEEDLPWEGVGCWNPVFPARIDDLLLLASVAAKYVVRTVAAPPEHPRLTVFEQHDGDDGILRLELAKEEPHDG